MANTTMQGKVILITGATNGIGKAAALELATMGATVIIGGRNPAKTEATASEIKAQSGSSSVDTLVGDLSSMAEVRRLADEFKSRYQRLDVLINNAGAIFSEKHTTVDGYEMTFAFNHLAYFLLTELLLDRVKASAPSRIINVTSDAHRRWPSTFEDAQSDKPYSFAGFQEYSQSKLANVLFTYELARRLEGMGVTVNTLHPGAIATGFGRNTPGVMATFFRLIAPLMPKPERGAETVVYLASSPEVEGVTGQYFENRKPVQSSRESYDEATARRLWAVSQRMTGLA